MKQASELFQDQKASQKIIAQTSDKGWLNFSAILINLENHWDKAFATKEE
jgi:hypothetical protein